MFLLSIIYLIHVWMKGNVGMNYIDVKETATHRHNLNYTTSEDNRIETVVDPGWGTGGLEPPFFKDQCVWIWTYSWNPPFLPFVGNPLLKTSGSAPEKYMSSHQSTRVKFWIHWAEKINLLIRFSLHYQFIYFM